MKSLFIDTHLNDIVIILTNDGQVIEKEVVRDKKNNSEILFPTITKVIDKHEINEIVVVNGPGSFTGVRLGVTIAKTLAYTLNIPIRTITSLEVMAISKNKKRVAISDNNGYYIGDFTDDYKVKEYKYITNEEFDKENYDIGYEIDINKVLEHLKNIESLNPHEVNPIYIKKIGVEIDQKSK